MRLSWPSALQKSCENQMTFEDGKAASADRQQRSGQTGAARGSAICRTAA